MAAINFQKQILSVGSVNIKRCALTISNPDTSVSFMEDDKIPDDMFFRVYMGVRCLFRDTSGSTSSSFRVSLKTDSDAQSIWNRYVRATDDTGLPDNLQGAEHAGGEFDFQPGAETWRPLESRIWAPGIVIQVTKTAAGLGDQQIDFRFLLAESPDPRDLWPFVGARIGGIAGEVNERAGA